MNSVGDAIKARRLALGMSQKELGEHADISMRQVGKVERDEVERVMPLTAVGLERALLWRPGSLDAIKAGGEPTEMKIDEIKALPDEMVPPLVKKQLSTSKAAVDKATNVGGRIIFDAINRPSLGCILEEKFANLGLSTSAWEHIAETAQTVDSDEVRRDAAEQPRADLGSLRESMRNLDELPGFVQAVILAQAEEELPRAIAALDEARRVELVRAAFALWDAQDGLGGAGAGAGAGGLAGGGVAGGRNRAAADGTPAAPHTGARRAVNGGATGN